MNISKEVWVEDLEKLADGTYKRKNHIAKARNGVTFDEHLADDASLTKKGHVQLSNSTNSTSDTMAATPSAVKKAMDKANEAFTSASNGKKLVGEAITGVDDSVVIPTEPTFAQLATAIGQISTGKKWASGEVLVEGGGKIIASGLGFKPQYIIAYPQKYNGSYGGFYDGNASVYRWHIGGGEGYDVANITGEGFSLTISRYTTRDTWKWIAFE